MLIGRVLVVEHGESGSGNRERVIPDVDLGMTDESTETETIRSLLLGPSLGGSSTPLICRATYRERKSKPLSQFGLLLLPHMFLLQ
jgi:hypothetical protein